MINRLTVATVLLGTVLTGSAGTAHAEAPAAAATPAPAAQQEAPQSTEQIVVIKGQRVKVSDLIPTAGNGWRMEFTPVDADGAPLATTASARYVVSGCAGTFFTPNKVNNRLEWGAEQSCTGTYAPQYIRMRLQSTCNSWYCARFVDETSFLRTPGSEDYSRVSRLFFADYCDTGTFRKYRVEAIPYVRGVQFSPKFSNESVQACDISP